MVEAGGGIAGSAVVLWRKGHPAARLYSITIGASWRGKGLGRVLLEAAEDAARRHGSSRMSLEVRSDNEAAVGLYRSAGYRHFRDLPGYYEDGGDAVRMVRDLTLEGDRVGGGEGGPVRLEVPYYPQTLGFTCGPACLMMVLKYFQPDMELDRTLELNLWKEATVVYTTSGPGGSGPFGLALAAARRGLPVHVRMSEDRVPFTSGVRRPEKRQVIELMHRDQEARAAELGVRTSYGDFRLADLARELRLGMIPIVLVSTWRLHRVKEPHWVVLTGLDEENVYFHDPYEGSYLEEREAARHFPLPQAEFDRMRRHAKDVRKAAVIIGP